jgi:hypothetical protein
MAIHGFSSQGFVSGHRFSDAIRVALFQRL